MEGSLGTTNLLLGIIMVVQVIYGLALIGAAIAGYMVYRRAMELINGLEERQVAPAMARVNAILDDVKGVSAKLREETERADQAIRTTMDRVDDTVDRMRSNVRAKTSWVVGVMRGARVAIENVLHGDGRGDHHQPNEV